MSAANFPVDLVLFGMIALFLVLRLRSILGRRQGFEGMPESATLRRAPGPVIEGRAEQVPPPAVRKLPDPASEIGQVLSSMQAVDRGFAPGPFLNGAEGAFRMIVAAFAAGDRDKLRPLLTPETFAAFEGALAAREAAGETQHTEIRGILEAAIDHASLQGKHAEITVRFVSQQVAITHASDGTIVAGADAVTELVDVWSFVRDLTEPGAVWRLAAAHSA
jgi:predicted lipid-binding transport protein (Tim44 family)